MMSWFYVKFQPSFNPPVITVSLWAPVSSDGERRVCFPAGLGGTSEISGRTCKKLLGKPSRHTASYVLASAMETELADRSSVMGHIVTALMSGRAWLS